MTVHDPHQAWRRFGITGPGEIGDPVIACVFKIQSGCQHAITGADRFAYDTLALRGRRAARLVVDNRRRQIL